MPPKLGILAGGGDLPLRLAAACREAGREYLVIAFDKEADPEPLADHPHAWSRLGAVGKTFKLLREAGCREVVLVGKVHRPALSSLRPDARGAALLAKFARLGLNDEAVLSTVVSVFEDEGFRVVGPHEVLGGLLAPEGSIGAREPDADDRRDIDYGIRVVRALGAVDVGQAAVVAEGVVLGVEALEGTDALIERCAALQRKRRGGVLVKLTKPGQDRRLDLPTIGVTTVETAARAGLRGIAVEAGSALVIDHDAVARAADQAGLFVVGIALEND